MLEPENKIHIEWEYVTPELYIINNKIIEESQQHSLHCNDLVLLVAHEKGTNDVFMCIKIHDNHVDRYLIIGKILLRKV